MQNSEYWRKKNWYYHNDVDNLISFLVPDNTSKIEFSDGEKVKFFDQRFEYIVLNNCIGSMRDIQGSVSELRNNLDEHGRLVLIFHNYLWEPIFNILEFFGLKHKPERPNWLSRADVENFLYLCGFESVRSGRRLLLPFYIPIFSVLVNRFIAPLPIFSSLCITEYVVARPVANLAKRDYSVSVIVPARNEAGNIEKLVEKTPELGSWTEIIFVEGHSKDETWQEILRVVEKYKGQKNIVAVQQDGIGKGDAVRKGFSLAKGELLMILDADMTVMPEDLAKFYLALAEGRGDFINGSRMIYPMEKQAMRFLNIIGNKFFAGAFSWILSQRIKDTLCGTKVLLKKDYEKIVANRSFFGDFDPFGDFDLIFGAAKLNMKIIDLPVRYRDRTYGTTQIQRFRHGRLLLQMVVFASSKFKFISWKKKSSAVATNKDIEEHFDVVADNYDYWKNKNWFYYDQLKKIAKDFVGDRKKILDIGCGTGTILRELDPQIGLGLDISPEMIEIAKKKSIVSQNISYLSADIIDFVPTQTFDGVLFFDVVDHIPDY